MTEPSDTLGLTDHIQTNIEIETGAMIEGRSMYKAVISGQGVQFTPVYRAPSWHENYAMHN